MKATPLHVNCGDPGHEMHDVRAALESRCLNTIQT